MKILALESSAVAASAALCDEQKIIGDFFLQTGQTHSQTLMPMVQQLLDHTSTTIADLDAIAVCTGPGSFTGLRIATAAVQGMAFGANIPCISVSTLKALAYNFYGLSDCLVCAVMDARCDQVYTATFLLKDGNITRLVEDSAEPVSELQSNLQKTLDNYNLPIFLVGDGAEMCYNRLSDFFADLRLAPPHIHSQRAAAVALAAAQQKETVKYNALLPTYLRKPQAERELEAKQLAQTSK